MAPTYRLQTRTHPPKDAPCGSEHTNPDSLAARLSPSVIAVTIHEAFSLLWYCWPLLNVNTNTPHLYRKHKAALQVLEAFGIANTAHNNNSSRFGKYLHLKMDGTDLQIRNANPPPKRFPV